MNISSCSQSSSSCLALLARLLACQVHVVGVLAALVLGRPEFAELVSVAARRGWKLLRVLADE